MYEDVMSYEITGQLQRTFLHFQVFFLKTQFQQYRIFQSTPGTSCNVQIKSMIYLKMTYQFHLMLGVYIHIYLMTKVSKLCGVSLINVNTNQYHCKVFVNYEKQCQNITTLSWENVNHQIFGTARRTKFAPHFSYSEFGKKCILKISLLTVPLVALTE